MTGPLAHAQSFRYWGYYQWDGTAWAFAQTGPADTVPANGAIEGWRFAVTGEESARFPRVTPDFATICPPASVPAGSKQVAVVLDYGTAEDAPAGETPPAARGACATVPEDATGADVMAAVSELRLGDGGFICGFDGYPATGCGDSVRGDAPSGPEEDVVLVLPDTGTTEPDASPTATASPSPDAESPAAESPVAESPDAESPDAESPDAADPTADGDTAGGGSILPLVLGGVALVAVVGAGIAVSRRRGATEDGTPEDGTSDASGDTPRRG
jgi:hypothetical protein